MNILNSPRFTAEMSIYQQKTSYRMMTGDQGSSGIIPQLPKWVKCAAYIGVEVAACIGGPSPACIAAAVKAVDACT